MERRAVQVAPQPGLRQDAADKRQPVTEILASGAQRQGLHPQPTRQGRTNSPDLQLHGKVAAPPLASQADWSCRYTSRIVREHAQENLPALALSEPILVGTLFPRRI